MGHTQHTFKVDLEKPQYTTYGDENYRAVRDSTRCTSTGVIITQSDRRVILYFRRELWEPENQGVSAVCFQHRIVTNHVADLTAVDFDLNCKQMII